MMKQLESPLEKLDKALVKLYKVPAKVEKYDDLNKKIRAAKSGNSYLSRIDKRTSAIRYYIKEVYDKIDAEKELDIANLNQDAQDVNSLMNELIAKLDNEMSVATQNADAVHKSATIALPLITIFAIAIALACGFIISRLIVKAVNQVAEVAQKVADGDLHAKADVKSKDEIGDLANNINLMVDGLKDIISQVKNVSTQG